MYTYGSWFPAAGYGYCWRPYGVGFGWSPFDYGSWYFDPFFGWSFLGGYSWGWLPYHYGGWLFQPGVGWIWSPRGTGTRGAPGLGKWQPVTGVWMRGSGGAMGIVPTHPMDVRGKTPLNLSQGLYAVTTRGVTGQITPQSDARWKVENKPGREVIQNQLATASAPVRVSRSMVESATGRNAGAAGSSIVFDRNEGRFVNSGNARAGDAAQTTADAPPVATRGSAEQTQRGTKVYPAQGRNGNDARVPPASDRMNTREGQGRQATPAARNTPAPPSVPRAVTNERVFNQNNGGQVGGQGAGRSSGSAGAGASSGASRGSAPSGGAGASGGGGRSSGGGSSGGGSTGGGRPH